MTNLKLEGLRLSDGDLDFIVQEAAPEFGDKEKLKQLMREDGAFRRGLVEDEKVFRRVMADDEMMLRVSPALLFEVLLRRALKELQRASHTVERAGTQAIPVFDAEEVVGLLVKPGVLDYLAHMLSSFTRIQSYVIPIRVRAGIWRKIRFNDLDIDSLIRFCNNLDEEHRFSYYKSIADVCLFILGVFPEYAQFAYRYPLSGRARPRIAIGLRRSMEEYEEAGKRFYGLAGKHPAARSMELAEVFWLLHENFNAAKKPLNFIFAHYLNQKKHTLFGM